MSSNAERMARVVFGEARGEPEEGQRAVASTIINRSRHSGYPNTIDGVINQMAGGRHQYETLDLPGHDRAWQQAKSQNSPEYRNAMNASNAALRGNDPTGGATDFANSSHNPAVTDSQYYRATNKRQIGNHYFVSREAR